jgi:ATP-binding cassette subfamily B protein
MMSFPYYKQPDQMDCGPTCIRMVAKHYGRHHKQHTRNKMAEVTATPTLLLNGYSLPGLYQLPDLKYMLE